MKDFKKFGGGFGGNKRNGGGFKGRDGGRPSFGGKPGFKKFGGDRGFGGPKEMFQATCAKCHNSCEVPFRPNGEKPVYCNDCFGGKEERGNFTPRFEKRDDRSERSFRPAREERNDRPFVKQDNGNEEVKRQLSDLNRKIDSLVELMKRVVDKPEVKKEEKIVKENKVNSASLAKVVKNVVATGAKKKEVKAVSKDKKKKGPAKK